MTKIHKILGSVGIVVVLLGIYILVDRKSGTELKNNTSGISTTTDTTTITDASGVTYTIEPVGGSAPTSVPQPIPDLNRPVVKSSLAVVLEADFIRAGKKVKELQSELKNTPTNFANWLDLAMYQKMGGDYDGAIISWKYASRLDPTDFISLGNIGNLYAYSLKDTVSAETYYKQAIAKDPKQVYLYTQLAEIYKDLVGDSVKARAIIDQGLSKIPNDPGLLEFRARI